MARERKRDTWRRRLFGSKDLPVAASSQAYDSKSASSTSELAPAVLSPIRANTPDPAPSEQVKTLETQQQELETPNDVWAAAFQKFLESDGDLAKAYAKLLNPAHEEDATKFDVDFIESTVKRLDKERDEKQWKVAFAGKSIHIRSQVEKMVKFLLWTDTVVKPALSTQPYAALAWSAVSIFLPLVKAGTELHETLLAGLEEVNRILVFWKISESSIYPFQCHARRSFYGVFIDLHHRIIRYYAHAVCHLSSTQLSRARESLVGWNGWEDETRSINELNRNCQNYLEATQRKAFKDSMEAQLVEIRNSRLTLEDISRSLEEIQFQYENELERKLLGHLHADFKGHKNANPERVQGTCEWVLQDPKFHRWRDNAFSSLLWISAGPGYGKSVLSRSLIDEKLLQSPARATTSSVCYFFFKDGDERRKRACDAVAAILHQLFAQDLTGRLIKKALTPYHRAGAGLRDSFDELWDILISCMDSPDAGEIICVLDALDECERLERQRLTSELRRFYNAHQKTSQSTSTLKFIITSRTWNDIEVSLEDLFMPMHPSQSSHVNGDQRLRRIRGEIELVIEQNLPAIAGHLPESDQKFLGKRMKDMENRTYLWLRLFFQIIKEDRMNYRKTSDIIDLLESLPSEVSEVYEKILQPFYDNPKTKLLFQLMLAASKPLTLKAANEALTLVLSTRSHQWKCRGDIASDYWGEDFQSVVQNCTGFLVVVTGVDTYEEKLSFLHQTVREFLLGSKPTPNCWKGRFNITETQITMFSTCLKSLRFLYLSPLPDEEDQNHKFEHYAAKNWPIYYELLDEDEKAKYDDQVRLLCDTTQPGTAKWLSFNGVFQRLETLKQLQAENFDSSSLAALFGFGRLVKKVKQADVLDSVQAKDNKVSPLQAASWNGKLDIVKELIRNKADIDYNPINIGSPIECAVRNAHIEVVEFLLTCTPAPVIRKETLESASRSHLSKSLLELISQRDPDLEVSEMLFKVAVENRSSGGDALESLLHDHPDLKPSDNTILMAVRNESCNPKVLKILFDRHDDLRVTEEMVEEASLRWTDGSEVLLLLFDSSPQVNVTDDALVMAAGNANNGVAIMKLFLEKRPGLNIPQKAFRAAAENIISSTEMLRILFESRNGEQVTSDLIMGAMNNSKQGQATLDFLASQDGFNITQTCVETWFQTEQKFSFYENIAHAMGLGGDAITITEPMMKKIISWDLNYTDAFLRTIGSDFAIPITDDIYQKSYHSCLVSRDRRKGANRGYQHFKTMKLLMGAQRRDIRIKGDDGNWLTEEEVMNKLDSWERELDEFFK